MYLMERKTQMETYIQEAARVEEETEAARTRVTNLRTALSALNEQAEQFQNDIAAANVQVNPINGAAGHGDLQAASLDYGGLGFIRATVPPEGVENGRRTDPTNQPQGGNGPRPGVAPLPNEFQPGDEAEFDREFFNLNRQ
jgi:hypothetical protein